MSGEVEADFDPYIKNISLPLAYSKDIHQAVMISSRSWEQISMTSSAWAAFKKAAVLVSPLDGTHVLL